MARVALVLSCSAEAMAKLQHLSGSRSREVRLAERAHIVMACLQGWRKDEVASEIGVQLNTVGQCRRRFAAGGIAGLRDRSRSGKLAMCGVKLCDRMLAPLESPPPAGMAS
jgi:hypothetical protein